MLTDSSLERFLNAQKTDYAQALSEIRNGQKRTHWMWYIFQQLAGLGYSEMAHHYAIKDLHEARAYLDHPVLGPRLIDIATALLQVKGKTASQLMGRPDDVKLKSSMTLFSLVKPGNPVFEQVLAAYFQGLPDDRTISLVNNSR